MVEHYIEAEDLETLAVWLATGGGGHVCFHRFIDRRFGREQGLHNHVVNLCADEQQQEGNGHQGRSLLWMSGVVTVGSGTGGSCMLSACLLPDGSRAGCSELRDQTPLERGERPFRPGRVVISILILDEVA